MNIFTLHYKLKIFDLYALFFYGLSILSQNKPLSEFIILI